MPGVVHLLRKKKSVSVVLVTVQQCWVCEYCSTMLLCLLYRTCNEAVRGDMGLDSLQGRRDKAKLK